MNLTDREAKIIEYLRTFKPEQMSGEITVRVRDGEPVQVVPSPAVKLGDK